MAVKAVPLVRWRPMDMPLTRPGSSDEQLKAAIKQRYGVPSKDEPQMLNGANIWYFKGLAAAGIPGAAEIVERQEQFGEIHIWVETPKV